MIFILRLSPTEKQDLAFLLRRLAPTYAVIFSEKNIFKNKIRINREALFSVKKMRKLFLKCLLIFKQYVSSFDILCLLVGGWVVRRCHVSFVTRGVQLILAYSWARPAILVAGKGREVMFLFLLFLHFHSCFSFFPVPPFHLFCYLFCLFSPFLWETTQNDPQGLTCR